MAGENPTDPAAARAAVVGRLTRGALHELGNPLVALIGTAELAAGSAEPGSRLRARLDLINETASEVADVVRALQRVARVDATEEPELVDLSAEAAAALELVRRLSPGRTGELEGTSPATPAVVEARPGALLVALAGLLLDALESAPHGAIRLAVTHGEGCTSASVAPARASGDSHALAASAGAALQEDAGGVALVFRSGF